MTPHPDHPCARLEPALIAMAFGAPTHPDLATHLAACTVCRHALATHRKLSSGLLCGPTVSPGERIASRLMRMLGHRRADLTMHASILRALLP